MILKLNIIGQKIYCDEAPFLATESKNYLKCEFEFSTDWEGCIKTAIFRGVTGVPYCIEIEDDACTVPYEVLTGNVFLISVFGILDDKRITTNTVDIYVKDSGYAEGETPPAPTPTVYEKMLKELHTINTIQQEELDDKAEKLAFERLQYYGDANIVPTEFDSDGNSYFTYEDNLDAEGKADGTITITGITEKGKAEITDLVIPYEIDGKIVNAIDNHSTTVTDGVFKSITIKNVIMPNCIKIIGDGTFSYSGVTNISISNSVTHIGHGAFYSCTSLNYIELPCSVTYIGGSTFYYCTSLKCISIPDSVTYIGDNAFRHCKSLQTVELGINVMNLYQMAFGYCDNLTEVIIPKSTSTTAHNINGGAFYKCTNLKCVYILDDNATIHNKAFDGCSNVVIICNPGSAAETYANKNSIPYRYDTINPSEYAATTEIESLKSQANNIEATLNTKANQSDITSLQTQIGDIATILADIKADQEALINGGEE